MHPVAFSVHVPADIRVDQEILPVSVQIITTHWLTSRSDRGTLIGVSAMRLSLHTVCMKQETRKTKLKKSCISSRVGNVGSQKTTKDFQQAVLILCPNGFHSMYR